MNRRAKRPQARPFPVPSGANMFVAAASMHVSPHIWGPDALSFCPTRFIDSPQSVTSSGTVRQETLVEPDRGVFLPWGIGPRACPGRKMAQVEFVATVRQVLSSWRIEPAQRPGESREAASKRLRELVADSQPQVSQQLRHPERVSLRFTKREK